MSLDPSARPNAAIPSWKSEVRGSKMTSTAQKAYLAMFLSVSAAALAVAAEPQTPAQTPVAAAPSATAAPSTETPKPASKPHWSWQPVQAQFVPVVKQKEWVRNAHRRLRSREDRSQVADAVDGRRSRNLHPPRHARRLGRGADARRGRRLRQRPEPRRLRKARRPPARVAALRRTSGAPLARSRALRRQRPAFRTTARAPICSAIAIT